MWWHVVRRGIIPKAQLHQLNPNFASKKCTSIKLYQPTLNVTARKREKPRRRRYHLISSRSRWDSATECRTPLSFCSDVRHTILPRSQTPADPSPICTPHPPPKAEILYQWHASYDQTNSPPSEIQFSIANTGDVNVVPCRSMLAICRRVQKNFLHLPQRKNFSHDI